MVRLGAKGESYMGSINPVVVKGNPGPVGVPGAPGMPGDRGITRSIYTSNTPKEAKTKIDSKVLFEITSKFDFIEENVF